MSTFEETRDEQLKTVEILVRRIFDLQAENKRLREALRLAPIRGRSA